MLDVNLYICTSCVCLLLPGLTAEMGSQRGVLIRQTEARGRECDEVDHSKIVEACGRVQQEYDGQLQQLKRKSCMSMKSLLREGHQGGVVEE